jgi:hypothetical protein
MRQMMQPELPAAVVRCRLCDDNQDESRIASSRNASERAGHCLTRMLPWPDQLVNLGGSAKPAFLFDR